MKSIRSAWEVLKVRLYQIQTILLNPCVVIPITKVKEEDAIKTISMSYGILNAVRNRMNTKITTRICQDNGKNN